MKKDEIKRLIVWLQTRVNLAKGGHEIMGIKHNHYNVQGVQFHPESILTTRGHDLLRNFLLSISLRF